MNRRQVTPSGPPDVVVVGSLNQDLVARVPRIPVPGETVLASGHATYAGGKGANQATAAARLGATVAMVGRVGDDGSGVSLRSGLEADGIDAGHVTVDQTAGTGLALINVDDAGENAITVSAGANGNVGPKDVTDAGDLIASAKVLLVQMEIPIKAVSTAIQIARGIVVLNPAPAAPLPDEMLARVDVLIPNQSELALLAARRVDDADGAAQAAAALPVDEIVVTLGAAGALLVTRTGSQLIPSVPVEAVDTTGAGDSFCGAIAAELARGAYLEAAVRFATKVAAIAVGRPGAQASMPTREELTLS